MSGHTPGPWGLHKNAHAAVVSASGMLVANCGGHFNNMRDPDELIAEQEANARLIAAAPELLDVLRHIHAHGYDMEEYEMVRDVLAKATGEKPE